MDNDELEELLKEMVTATISLADNVEVIARNFGRIVDKIEEIDSE